MKILLATDGSECSVAAVEEVAHRMFPAGSQVRVVSVAESRTPLSAEPYLTSAEFYEQLEKLEHERAQEALKRATEMLHAEAKSVDLEITTGVLTGSPKRAIVEEAERCNADLIVVGSHGYRSWERMLLGSVSQAVAMHARCSVLIVRRRAN